MSKSDPRIKWTDEENLLIAKEFIRLYGYNDIGGVTAKVRDHCQSVLPPNRRRSHLQGPSHLKTLLPVLARLRKLGPQTQEPVNGTQLVPEAAAVQEPVEPIREVDDDQSFSIESVPTMRDDIKDVLSSFIADVLVDATKKLLTNGDIARMLRSLQNGRMPEIAVPEQVIPKPLGPTSVPREQKPTVLVCGFLPHQQNEFAQAFPGLHLKFWYSDKPSAGIETLREKARSADIVMFKMEQTSHTAVRVVQTLGRRILRVTGGGQAMQAALESFQRNRLQ